MGIFSRKTKRDAGEFSQDFFDRFIFGLHPTGTAFASIYAETTRKLVSEVVPSFAEVSLPKLTEELRALWLETIGTAWTHQSKPEAAVAVSEFTKRYLSNIDRADLWEAMTDYNKVVARSVTHGADPNSGAGRARATSVNQMRFSQFKAWREQGRDLEAAARVANRCGSELSWEAGITAGFLAIRLTLRLGVEGSDLIFERLSANIHGFYQGAKEALEKVELTA